MSPDGFQSPSGDADRGKAAMMQDLIAGEMMWGMGLPWLLLVAFLVIGAVALARQRRK
jgi:hypothetical protein